ncbi:MAG: tetratricopeptide repeat protein [Gammaproteobacteria bacterium]|nr:tetratricopeptide repeat protein [Gammaproteobacteria bacterium]
MDDKSFQAQLSTNEIVERLKKAIDFEDEKEKLKTYSKGFEDLGDCYFRDSDLINTDILKKHRLTLKAVCLYNLALASGGDQQILLTKIQMIEKGILNNSGGMTHHLFTEEYISEIQGYKQDLASIRSMADQHLAQIDIASIEVKTVYQNIAMGLKKLITKMIRKCFEVMLPPQYCQYSIIVLGSLAREEATPYSDFEWAILINDASKKNIDYFRRLTELVWIKILNLQETTSRIMDIAELDWFLESDSPCSKGFSFDGQMLSGCHTPLGNGHHTLNKIRSIEQNSLLTAEEKDSQIRKIKDSEYELIGTPEGLAQFQSQQWETKRGFCTVLSTVALIISNNDNLVRTYEENMAEIWNLIVKSNPDQTMIQLRSLTYLTESVERFKFKGGHFGEETHFFDAKYDLYRLPNMFIDHVSSYWCVQSKNLWERIEHIFGEAGVVFLPEKSKALKRVVSQILGLRLRAYANKGYRDDHIVMFDSQKPEKNEAALKKYLGVDETLLLQIYSELIELQWRMESFIEQRGAVAAMAWQYGDVSDFTKGEVYRLLLNFPKAIAAFEESKRRTIAAHSSAHLFVAETLNSLGAVYEAQARYSEAIVAYEESKQIMIAAHSSKHLSVADVQNYLGIVYRAQARYPEAIKAFEEAKQIRIAIQGAEHLSVADTLNNLGNVYREQALYPDAIVAFDEAKRIRVATYGTEDLLVADTLNNLGNVYKAQARYREAITVLEEAKRIRISIHGPEHLHVADTLNNLGNVYRALAQYPVAIAVYEDSKRITIAIHGSEHPSVAATLGNLGAVYIVQLRYSEAIVALEEAKRIKEVNYGPEHLSVGDTLNSLGATYAAQARYPEAIGAYKESIRITIATHSPEHLSVAETLNNLGMVYKSQARYPEAIAAYEEAKRIKIVTYHAEHPSIANTQLNIGLVLIEQGKFEEARALFQAAIVVYDGVQHPNREKAKICLVSSYIREGNTYMLQQEVDIDRASNCYHYVSSSLNPQDPKVHQDLAKQFYDSGQLTAVLEHYRILALLRSKDASIHQNLACVFHAQACMEQCKGESKVVLDYLKKAEDHFEQAIQLDTNTSVCTEYAQFLWKNRVDCGFEKIVALLQKAIGLKQMENGLSYGPIERSTVDQYLQGLLDQENKLTFRAYYLAHYLLIKVYCVTDQLSAAQILYRNFQALVKEDEVVASSKKVALLAKISALIKENPDKKILIEMKFQQQLLANESRQRLHTKLVDGSQAEIERCIVSQIHESKEPTRSPTVSPRLLRDSPILAKAASDKTLSKEEDIQASLNTNL